MGSPVRRARLHSQAADTAVPLLHLGLPGNTHNPHLRMSVQVMALAVRRKRESSQTAERYP